MDSLKMLFMCMGLLCIINLTAKADPKPDSSENTEIYREVEVNTSFGVQVVSVNYNLINLYKVFQTDTACNNNLTNDFSKSSLIEVWNAYHNVNAKLEYVEETKDLIVEKSY